MTSTYINHKPIDAWSHLLVPKHVRDKALPSELKALPCRRTDFDHFKQDTKPYVQQMFIDSGKVWVSMLTYIYTYVYLSLYTCIYIYISPYHLPHLQFIAPSSWNLCISLYYSFHTLDLQSWNPGGTMHAAQLNASYTARAAKRAERVDMSLIPILATAGRLRICWNFVATCNGPETACCPESERLAKSCKNSQRTGFFANIQ